MKIARTAQLGLMLAGSLIILVVLGTILGLTIKQNDMIKNYIHLTAQSYFESIVLTRRWNASHNGVFVLKRKGVKSNPYLKNPDISTIDGTIYTKKNPALMTREISELAAQHGTFTYHITSQKPLNPGNNPDEWEKEALSSFDKGNKEFSQITQKEGKKIYRFMKPLFYEDSCANCHGKQGYKPGDIRGGISVMLPYEEIETALKGNQKRMLGLGLSILMVMGTTFYLLVWRLMKKLNNTVDLLDNEKRKLENSKADLSSERNKLNHIVSNLNADLLLIDKEMKVKWVNKRLEKKEEYCNAELQGRLCYKDYCNLDCPPDNCPVKISFKSGKPESTEHLIILRDGTKRYYQFSASPVKNTKGEVVNVLELIQNITERKKQEKIINEHVEKFAEAQDSLLEKNIVLERLNKLFVDREFRIKELKDRIKELEKN
jgi:PAS domain S-box-containing protein